jgi:hypothetical protein
MSLILLKEQYTFIRTLPDQTSEYREQFWHFNTTTKEVDTLQNDRVTYSGAAPRNYTMPSGTKFYVECIGTSENGYYSDGNGGFTTLLVHNSTACGYAPPADGTFIRTQCYGTDLYNVVADGNGGERKGSLVEANSTSCGVVYGCTDPYALDYNPSATAGNPQANVCTYKTGILSEVKVIDVQPCQDGVYLQWYNSLGGIDGHLFSGKVDNLYSSQAQGEFAYPNGLPSATGKVLTPSATLNTHELNQNRFDAICEVFASPLVWIVREDGSHQKVYISAVSDTGQRAIGQTSYTLQLRVSLQPLNALRN